MERNGEKASSSIVRDAVPVKRRSTGQNSLYTCCGCDYEKDVIQPIKASADRQNRINEQQSISAASPLKPTAVTQTSVGNIVPETLFPPPAAAILAFLQSRGFPIGLCKSMVLHAQSVPWRIVLVDCRYETLSLLPPLCSLTLSHCIVHLHCCSTDTETATVDKTGLSSDCVYPVVSTSTTLPFFGASPPASPKSTEALPISTRWQEVGESLSFIAGLARTANAITGRR